MVYFQWLQMLKALPIDWLPAPLSKSSEDLADNVSSAWGLLSGRVASLDCLFQGLRLLQTETQQGIATNIVMRGLTRWVRAAGSYRKRTMNGGL